MKMSIQDKSDWINALKSGEYKQGKGVLNRNNKEFCCLGVLCELQKDVEYIKKQKDIGNNPIYIYDGNATALPDKLLEKFQIVDTAMLINTLVSMNDGASTFNEIADFIELNVEVITN